jgi:hypothetical protein
MHGRYMMRSMGGSYLTTSTIFYTIRYIICGTSTIFYIILGTMTIFSTMRYTSTHFGTSTIFYIIFSTIWISGRMRS